MDSAAVAPMVHDPRTTAHELREQLLAVDDLPRTPIRAWGKDLFLRPMTGPDRDSWEAKCLEGVNAERLATLDKANILVRCLVDAGGRRIFRDEDAAPLSLKNAKEIQRIYEAADGVVFRPFEEVQKNSCAGLSAGAS